MIVSNNHGFSSNFLKLIVNSPNTIPNLLAKPGPQAWHTHSDGIAALLSARGLQQFTSKMGRKVFWKMYIFIVSGQTVVALILLTLNSKPTVWQQMQSVLQIPSLGLNR
jgi:hypothetical protein